ncbi:MAG: hypothetical protein ACPGXK_13450 [Phycisphaerae bacterium]
MNCLKVRDVAGLCACIIRSRSSSSVLMAMVVGVGTFGWGSNAEAGTGAGADVIVSDINGVLNYGTLNVCTGGGPSCATDADCNACSVSGGPCDVDGDCPQGESCVISGETCSREVTAFSIGTWSCNIGDIPLLWCDLSHNPANCNINEHPAIVGNMYRLKDNRIEQLGMSWVKHGFAGVDTGGCSGLTCIPTGTDDLLGVGCRDLYSADLNANQPALGPRSEINASNGIFPYPFSLGWQTSGDELYKRVQVDTVDVMPELNENALYFVEGQYITPDDSAAGNGDNNVSYRRVEVTGPNENNRYLAFIQDDTVTLPAIRAWKFNNPDVVEADIDVPNDGLMILAAGATDLGDGFYQYEYALYNMNSDRSAGSLFVPLPLGAIVREVGFHDVDYHSGEPYDGTDWAHTITNAGITFETSTFDVDPLANAVRWGTLYNFRFESNVEPDSEGSVTVGLFKPGFPNDMTVTALSPLLDVVDCNNNGLSDADDLLAGTSLDCDENAVPDECQADCNENDVADTCDLADGTSQDCNSNENPDECDIDCNENSIPDNCEAFADCNANNIPDECEPDCNLNGIPDECEADPDTDQDGIPDCEDACRLSSPPQACACPLEACCDVPPFPPCSLVVDWEFCLEIGGTPECIPSDLCRDGCLIGDWNEDVEINLADVSGLLACFSGENQGGEPLSEECLRFFDYDEDMDVDLDDYLSWQASFIAD